MVWLDRCHHRHRQSGDAPHSRRGKRRSLRSLRSLRLNELRNLAERNMNPLSESDHLKLSEALRSRRVVVRYDGRREAMAARTRIRRRPAYGGQERRKESFPIFAHFCAFLRLNCLGKSSQRTTNDEQINTEVFPLKNHHAAHLIENSLRSLRAFAGAAGEKGNGGLDFQSAESIDRAGAQGLPLSQIPQLPQSRRELSHNGATECGAVARQHAASRRKNVAWRPSLRTRLPPSPRLRWTRRRAGQAPALHRSST